MNYIVFHQDAIQHLYNRRNNQQFVIEPRSLRLGYYVIVLAIIIRASGFVGIGRSREHIRTKVSKHNIDIHIGGGKIKKLGANESVLHLRAVRKEDSFKVNYDWFCALNRSMLPNHPYIYHTFSYGSCLLSKELRIARDKVAIIIRSRLVKNNIYYVRLIAWGPRIKFTSLDQKIVVESDHAMKMILKCLFNCRSILSAQQPIVYQIICSTCFSYVWSIVANNLTDPLEDCQNIPVCKIRERYWEKLNQNSSIALQVLGFDRELKKKVVFTSFDFGNPPRGGECFFQPPSGKAEETKFLVACQGFTDPNKLLSYKFLLLTSGGQTVLLQHGRSNLVDRIILSRDQKGIVTMLIEVCKLETLCSRVQASAYLFSHASVSTSQFGRQLSLSAGQSRDGDRLNTASYTEDIKRITFALVSRPRSTRFTTKETNMIIERLSNPIDLSSERSKMTIDILFRITNDLVKLTPQNKIRMWLTLNRVKDYFAKTSVLSLSEKMILNVLRTCLKLMAKVVEDSQNITMTQTAISISQLGKLLLTNRLPSEAPMNIVTSSLTADLRRLPNDHQSEMMKVGSVEIYVPRVNAVNEVINQEIYIFNGSLAKSKSVDYVILLSLTTGWKRFSDISNNAKLKGIFKFSPSMYSVTSASRKIFFGLPYVCDTKRSCSYFGSGGLNVSLEKMEAETYLAMECAFDYRMFETCPVTALLRNTKSKKIFRSKSFNHNGTFHLWVIPISDLKKTGPSYVFEVNACNQSRKNEKSSYLLFTVTTYSVDCLMWNDIDSDWTNSDCQLKIGTSLVCECPLLTSAILTKRRIHNKSFPSLFASRVFPLEGSFFGNESFITTLDRLKKNPLPIAAIIVVFSVYLLTSAWTYVKEKKERKNPDVIDLEDNSPFDTYHYFVTIYTGNRQGASTTSNVAIRLQGTKRKSKVHLLQKLDHQIFFRDTVHVFLISTRQNLGNITAVRLWHDNGGRSPEWYLQRISIHDPLEKECWLIHCDRWFDQVVDHLFLVQNPASISRFSKTFAVKLERYVKNQHLFFSVFAMQPWAQRVMSRRTRLSLSLVQIAFTMAITFFFYPKDDFSYFDIDFYSFQWNHVLIGMKSAAASYPITLLLSCLFLYSKRGEQRAQARAVNTWNDLVQEMAEKNAEDEMYEAGKDQNLKKQKYSINRNSNEVLFIDEESSESYNDTDSINDFYYVKRRRGHQKLMESDDSLDDYYNIDTFAHKNNYNNIETGMDNKNVRQYNKNKIRTTIDEESNALDLNKANNIAHKDAYQFHKDQIRTSVDKESNALGLNKANQDVSAGDHRNNPNPFQDQCYFRGFNVRKNYVHARTPNILRLRLRKNETRTIISSTIEERCLDPSMRSPGLTPSGGAVSLDDASEENIRTQNFTFSPISTVYFEKFFQYYPLPRSCHYLGWMLIFLCTIGSFSYSILMGFEEGLRTSKKWMVSVTSGILETIILFETFKAIFLALFHTIQFRSRQQIDLRDWLPPPPYIQIEIKRKLVVDNEFEYMEQHRERESNPAYFPTFYQVTGVQDEVRSDQRKLKRRFRDVSVHLAFLFFLLLSTMGQNQKEFHYFQSALNNMVLSPALKVKSYHDVFNWINSTLANVISGGYKSFFTSDELIILGQPTLRQKRIARDRSCMLLELTRKVKLIERTKCKPDYSSWTRDEKNYGPGWSNEPDFMNPFYSLDMSPWRYKRDLVPWVFYYYGQRGDYDGTGYYVTLPKQASKIRSLAGYLKRQNWIDDHTRVVILECAIHNIPLKVFGVLTVAIETTSLGTVTATSHVNFMHTHYVTNTQSSIVRVALYFLLVFVFYHFYQVAGSVREHGLQYFIDFWEIIHFFSAFLSGMLTVLYLTRASYSDRAIQSFKRNQPSFHLFHTATSIAYAAQCVLSMSVFFTLVYTVKILYGLKTFELFHTTFRRATRDLKGHSIYLIFVYFAFCHLGVLLFSKTSDFSSFVRSLQTVFGYSMEAFTSSDLLETYPTLGGFYLLAFEVMFTKALVNFYATLLENNYRETKLLGRDFIAEKQDLSLRQKQLRSMYTIRDQNFERMTSEGEKQNYLKQLEKLKKKEMN